MIEEALNPDRSMLPSHVPADIVIPFDFTSAEMQREPHGTMAGLHAGPRVFYSPMNLRPDGGQGIWVFRTAEDLRTMLQQPELFSNRGIARFSGLIGESWDLIPAEVDPPAHGDYRRILSPMFSPPRIRELESRIRAQAVELIEAFAGDSGCEFVSAFAKPLPIQLVMQLLGLPLERFDDVVAWGHDLHDGTTREQRSRGAKAIGVFLREQIARARTDPQDDVLSTIVRAEIDGRPLTDDETIGIAYLLFTGGIHTVTASLGFSARHLARDQALQDRLRANPSDIPAAIEELLRAYSVVNSYRIVVSDTELAGVKLKAGDWVFNSLPLANLDPAAFDNPLRVDIDRPNNRHVGFSFGPHFCLGAHLAKREMVIAWEELLARLPPFRAREEATQVIAGPTLLGVHHLELVW